MRVIWANLLRKARWPGIFTGAPIPAGADAVIPQEEATETGEKVR